MRSLRAIIVTVAVVLAGMTAFYLAPFTVERTACAADQAAAAVAALDALDGTSPADQLSRQFRNVAKAIMPSVVEVRVKQNVSGLGMGEEGGGGDPFEGMPNMPNIPPELRPFLRPHEIIGLGSGLIIDAEKGYVLTNYHVVEDTKSVAVILSEDRELQAEWIRSDPKTDLAIIKVKAEKLVAAQFGDSDEMEVGDWVLAIGSPAGLEHTVTAGIISGKGRRTAAGAILGHYESFLQTDAAINKGNSGGPLVNMRGKVIGINTAIVTPGGSGQNAGIGLSIPSNLVKQIMTQLIEKGKVTRGYLGISFQSTPKGLQVMAVLDGSPAEQGGMRVGDIVTAVDGQKMKDDDALRFAVANMPPNSKHTFTVRRGGQEHQLNVTIGEQPENLNRTFGLEGGQPGGEAQGVEGIGLKVSELTPALAQRVWLPQFHQRRGGDGCEHARGAGGGHSPRIAHFGHQRTADPQRAGLHRSDQESQPEGRRRRARAGTRRLRQDGASGPIGKERRPRARGGDEGGGQGGGEEEEQP